MLLDVMVNNDISWYVSRPKETGLHLYGFGLLELFQVMCKDDVKVHVSPGVLELQLWIIVVLFNVLYLILSLMNKVEILFPIKRLGSLTV
uniref:Uncharacterized protein n=1 Tax=Nelumbo nucifera TaxID=4432 RepID=A0A822YCH0_NELNU|nr:TPA_asm: hypothetical protein HUJ06_031281 [Nelumbo nucifera]